MENVVQFKIPTMLTIKETAQRTGMAEFFIRSLATNNQIVHVRCGRKYLINLEKFIEYLNTSLGEDEPEKQNINGYGIKPIKL